MSTVRDIFDALCEMAPLSLQMDFDNAGFLVGRGDRDVTKALLSLDITDQVVEEAVEERAQLIISHHPVIFQGVKTLTDDSATVKLLRMAERGISAVCMHTNLDIAEGGVNDILIEILGASCEGPLDKDCCGRVGRLPESISLNDFLIQCKTNLNARGLRYYDAGKPVSRLAVMGGAGADALEDAVALGCDTYVTSDIKYHQFLRAAELGLNLIDADHYCTENPVIPVLAQRLSLRFPEVVFQVSGRHRQVISFF